MGAQFDPKKAIQIKNTPAGNIAATNVQAAIDELDTEKQASLGFTPENIANKATDFSIVDNTKYPSVQAVKTYADGLVVGLIDDRGSYAASGNTFPASGGSGTAGAILRGDLWYISVAGVLGGVAVTIGDSVRALVDTPGQIAGNWSILESNIGYVPENVVNKENTTLDTSTTKYPTNRLAKEYADTKAPETATTIGALIGGAGDATPNDTDFVATSLTAGGILKKIIWTNVKAFFKTHFDTIYQAIGSYLTSGGALGTPSSGTLTNCTGLPVAGGGTGNTQGSGVINTNRFVVGATDFTLEYAGDPQGAPTWFGGLRNSGTAASVAGEANHPGIVKFVSSTLANSGGFFRTASNMLLLAGSETTEFIIRPQTISGTTIRMGFLDTITDAVPVDGAWLDVLSGVLSGKTRNNSVESVTGTTYTLVTNTWYRAKVVVNSNATRVDFYLYSEAGTQLWTDYLTTNIPITANRETGHGIFVTNSGTTAVNLADLDYMNLYIDRNLTR